MTYELLLVASRPVNYGPVWLAEKMTDANADLL